MIRVGLVGCGFIGLIHSFALRALITAQIVDARVTAIFDTDVDRAAPFARAHGADVARDLDSLLSAVDVVWICTWTSAHADIVEEAARRGVAIFCEKPLAPTLSECVRLAVAARAVPNQIGLVLRSAPVFAVLAELLHRGRYGRTMVATLRDDQFLPVQGQYASTWRSDVVRAGGGTLLEHSIHDLDVLRVLLGDPSTVSGTTSCFAGHAGIEDLAVVQMDHGAGARSSLVSVWHSVLSRPSTRRLEVFCERAFLWTEDDYLGPIHVQTSDGDDIVVPDEPSWLAELRLPEGAVHELSLYAIQARALLDALAAGRQPAPTVDDALFTHRIVAAAYESAAAGGVPISVPDGVPVHVQDRRS